MEFAYIELSGIYHKVRHKHKLKVSILYFQARRERWAAGAPVRSGPNNYSGVLRSST